MSSKCQSLSPKSALGRRYHHLFISEKFVDCSFKIDQKTIKCHKLILSTASPVFEAMFYGPMSEETDIRILDISPETFQLMVEYIYTCDVVFEQCSLETLIELYYSAEKYILTDLARICLNVIQGKLRYQNILPAIDLSFYMNLQHVLQTCVIFFIKCCLDEYQFFNEIKTNYYHVTRTCLKFIIQLGLESKHLPWFVKEWCKHECKSLGLTDCDYKLVYNDLELPNKESLEKRITSDTTLNFSKGYYMTCNYVERVYYKASRPFVITEGRNEFNVTVKTDRFISLVGMVISSRLMPQTPNDISYEQEYCETLNLEIISDNQIIHQQRFIDQKTNYNCDVNIFMEKNIVLSPNLGYRIKLIWDQSAFGAEYPCSLNSNEARGITFIDSPMNLNDGGSIFKGIKYLDLLKI